MRLVIAACAAAAFALGATATAQADGSLTGAGSTFVAPLMNQWAKDFQTKAGASITYGAVGSGAGISQITARTVDFGASDAPLNPTQRAACNACVQIPWALGGVGMSFRIDGVSKLNLTGPVISKIYQGQITNWNDPQIKALNKGVNLPDLKITPAFRSDGSGTTYAFANYLSRIDAGWRNKYGYSTSVGFPTGVGGKGNDGIAAIVNSTNGTIGYLEISYIIVRGLNAAAVKNAAGKFVFPNLKNLKAAGDAVKKVPASNEMHIVNPPKQYPKAYPISSFTYAIVPTSSPKAALLKQFIAYALTTGQKFGPALDYAPMPKVVVDAGKATLKKIR
jgi:phosphate transport system substrate-binding protein